MSPDVDLISSAYYNISRNLYDVRHSNVNFVRFAKDEYGIDNKWKAYFLARCGELITKFDITLDEYTKLGNSRLKSAYKMYSSDKDFSREKLLSLLDKTNAEVSVLSQLSHKDKTKNITITLPESKMSIIKSAINKASAGSNMSISDALLWICSSYLQE